MQLLRFQNQNIFVIQKSVYFCGRTIVRYKLPQHRSKKKVRWVIKHNEDMHHISCSISFYSGKKRATHNGHSIIDLVDTREQFDFIVNIGFQRMIFTIDQQHQEAKMERKYLQNEGSFNKWKSIYSGSISPVFEKYFGQ